MNQANSVKLLDVYSGKYDFFIFVIPVIFSFFLMYFFFNSNIDQSHLIYLILFKVMINQWHVFFTMFLALEQTKIINFLKAEKWIVLPVAFALPVIGFFSLKYFTILLGYFGLFHVIMQLYGFMRITNRKEDDLAGTWISQLLFWTIIITSFTYWFQGQSKVELSYFFYRNLIRLPQIVSIDVSTTVMSIFAGLYVLNAVKNFITKKIINAGQIYVLTATWIIFYFGLVISQSNNLFYLLSLMFHGVTYMGHVIYAKKKYNNGILINKFSNVFVTLFAASLWTFSLLYLVAWPVLIPLIYAPLIWHFIFDGYFWKKNRMPQFAS